MVKNFVVLRQKELFLRSKAQQLARSSTKNTIIEDVPDLQIEQVTTATASLALAVEQPMRRGLQQQRPTTSKHIDIPMRELT